MMTVGPGSFARIRPVLYVAAASRVICLAALWIGGRASGKSLSTVLTAWDGGYYRQIAEHGYPHLVVTGPNGVAPSRIAFFPLYPLLARGLSAITPMNFVWSGLVVSAVATCVAAILVFLIIETVANTDTAMTTGFLFVLQPMAFVFSLNYADAVLVAFVAAAILALLRERWILAGLASLCGGATRPTGFVLTACCLVVAILVFNRRRTLRPFVAVLLAPLGTVGFILWIGRTTGRSDAWFVSERDGWGSYFDLGVRNLRRLGFFATHPLSGLHGVAIVVYLLLVVALCILLIRERPPTVFLVLTLSLVALAFGTRNALSSAPRYLLPAFPLLVPIARRAARLGPRQRTWLLVGMTAVMSGAGVYFATVSHYPP